MSTTDYDKLLATIEAQERELQFDSFSNDDAWSLGSALVEKARSRHLAITIDICRGAQQLFHYAFSGTSADNDQWVIRKNRVVARFGRSSFAVGRALAKDGTTMEAKHYLSSVDYASHGGAFPLTLKGTGPVGTVTVSGLPQEEDHALVVETIREFLASRRQG